MIALRRIALTACLLSLGLAGAPAEVAAGTFTMTPLRLEFDAKTKTGVVKVTNSGSERVVVQLLPMEWRQDAEGKDEFRPSKELVVFPKIIDIEPAKEATVRIGYQGPAAREREHTFRLFSQELPVKRPGEAVVGLAVGFSIPVFVKAERPQPQPTLEPPVMADGVVTVRVVNSGNRHLQVGRILVTGLDAANAVIFSKDRSGWYLLPAVSRRYTFVLTTPECRNARMIRVAVDLGDTGPALEARLPVAVTACPR